ncbi:MAG TPA: LacI family DNA-binding transcriptional regulator [Brevundimonas sp.]
MKPRSTRRKGGGHTIDDVARHAGVSPMTVSRVINDERNVRDTTRKRVTDAIRELGYAPNQAARSLASAQTLKIGLLYSNPSAAYLSEFLLGGLDQCSRSGIQLIVEKCEPEVGEIVAIERLLASGVDGVLLPPPLCDSSIVIERLKAAGLPAVAVASGDPLPSVSAIRIDDLAAAQAMTRHLIGLGHRRIAFVRGHPNQTASRLRYEGYAKALGEHGLTVDDRLVVQGYFTYHSGLDAADKLLNLRHRPTAIFASNDDMAAAAIAVAHRQGLDVPRDLTIVGFDDTALASSVWPPLTTIRQPVAEMSREAVSILADAIRRRIDGQPPAATSELMDFALIRRQSDGHPPTGDDGDAPGVSAA